MPFCTKQPIIAQSDQRLQCSLCATTAFHVGLMTFENNLRAYHGILLCNQGIIVIKASLYFLNACYFT